MNVSGTLLLSPAEDAAAEEGTRHTTAHSGDRAGGGSAPGGTSGGVWRHPGSHSWRVLLAPGVHRPGTLLSTPQGTRPPPT